jgi:UDP-N-acetylmuramate: L-alanyl-gamma-D-glutamyl-meso-diaminopimelate ligase
VTSRKKIFEEAYGKAFDEADLVFLSTPALKSVDNPKDFIDPAVIVQTIKDRGVEASCYKNAEELLEDANKYIASGDVILIMSNGSFDGIHKKLADSLSL